MPSVMVVENYLAAFGRKCYKAVIYHVILCCDMMICYDIDVRFISEIVIYHCMK